MQKIFTTSSSLLRKVRYNYIPVSCYELKNKVNPVVGVKIGNNEAEFCELEFRVHACDICSCSRMLCLVLLRIISDYCWEVLSMKGEVYPWWARISTGWCREHSSSWEACRKVIVQSSDRSLGMSHSSCLMIDQASLPASARRTQMIPDLQSPLHLVRSWI